MKKVFVSIAIVVAVVAGGVWSTTGQANAAISYCHGAYRIVGGDAGAFSRIVIERAGDYWCVTLNREEGAYNDYGFTRVEVISAGGKEYADSGVFKKMAGPVVVKSVGILVNGYAEDDGRSEFTSERAHR